MTNVAAAASALNMIMTKSPDSALDMSSPLYPEVNHDFHDQDADRHPHHAPHRHDDAGGRVEQQQDVFIVDEIHTPTDNKRQRADNTRRRLGLGGKRLHFPL